MRLWYCQLSIILMMILVKVSSFNDHSSTSNIASKKNEIDPNNYFRILSQANFLVSNFRGYSAHYTVERYSIPFKGWWHTHFVFVSLSIDLQTCIFLVIGFLIDRSVDFYLLELVPLNRPPPALEVLRWNPFAETFHVA